MHLPTLKYNLSIVLDDLGIHYFSNFKLNQLKAQQASVISCYLFYTRLPIEKKKQKDFFS